MLVVSDPTNLLVVGRNGERACVVRRSTRPWLLCLLRGSLSPAAPHLAHGVVLARERTTMKIKTNIRAGIPGGTIKVGS